MKLKLFKPIIAASALAATLNCIPAAYADFAPYIGLDAFYLQTGIKNDKYGYFSNKRQPEVDVHIGSVLNECLGLELGYARAKKASRDFAASTRLTFKNQRVTKGPYFQILGEVPVGGGNKLFLLTGLGAAWKSSAVKFYNKNIDIYGKSHDTKLIPLASVGLRYKMQDRLSIRMLATWEQTGRLKSNVPADMVSFYGANKIRHKNSLKFGVGFEYVL